MFRCERLEEQLNDLTELHQNEILNLKQELASMEEKIAYQSYERARDIQVCQASVHMSEMNLKPSLQIYSVIQELFLTMSLSSFKIGHFRYQACLANEWSGRGDKKKKKKSF